MRKHLISLLLICLVLAGGVCLPSPVRADGEVRPLPIDLSGGAPYTQKYKTDLEVYEDPSIRVENGTARFEFYTSDHQVPYRIILEGLAEKQQPVFLETVL